jgi:hypothetical protein
MSTEPEGWSSPKTNWAPNDNIGASDLNRWEGNPLAIETGDRTLDQSQTPASHVGGLRQILDWFANRIKAITGGTNWYDAPATTLAAAKSHMDAAAPHGGHETPGGAQGKVDAHADENITGSVAVHGIKQGDGNGLDADKLDGKHWVVIQEGTRANLSTGSTATVPLGKPHGFLLGYVRGSDAASAVYDHWVQPGTGSSGWYFERFPDGYVNLRISNKSGGTQSYTYKVMEWQ